MAERRIGLGVLLIDLSAIPVALFLAYLLRYGGDVKTGLLFRPAWWGPLAVMIAALGVWLLLYEHMALDCFREGWHLPATISRIILATAILMSAILAVAYSVQLYYSRLLMGYFAIVFCALVLLIRLLAHKLLSMRHDEGKTRRVVIVGKGRVAGELARRIERHPELLYTVVGLLNPSAQLGNDQRGKSCHSLGHLTSLDALRVLEEKGVNELIVCLEEAPVWELQSFIDQCRQREIRVNLLPQPYELYTSRAKLLEIEGIPLISLEPPDNFRVAIIFKRTTDLLLGLPLLLLSLPFVVVSMIVLKCQGRAFLRRELRGGRTGNGFWMYRLDIERDASDATAFQRFIYRVSISELPQLLNVLLGQMSLVGPRPESLDRVRNYSDWQRRRLKITPGMTGLAQVNGLREQHSSEDKTRYDLKYMVHWTPATDFILLLNTVWTLAGRLWTRGQPPAAPASKQRDQYASVPFRSPAE